MIARLSQTPDGDDLRDLARLLVDAVDSGAAVSFLAPLTLREAEDWWRGAISNSPYSSTVLVARDVEGIVGCVQLQPAWEPNQPHRAEITKLMVLQSSRRKGLGTTLMRAVEEAARSAGFRLLTLRTRRGDAAERLYLALDWTAAGTIPGFALDSEGKPEDVVFFYKELRSPTTAR